MKVSTNTRNAVNCIIDLSMHGGELVSLPSIAKRQAISIAYLEQIFAKLRRAGLVHAVRGPRGGYKLACETISISVADILYAVEDKVDATACSGKENCKGGHKCLSHNVWQQLNNQIHEYLQQIKLDYLIAQAADTVDKVPYQTVVKDGLAAQSQASVTRLQH